jgi:hypothetical protein
VQSKQVRGMCCSSTQYSIVPSLVSLCASMSLITALYLYCFPWTHVRFHCIWLCSCLRRCPHLREFFRPPRPFLVRFLESDLQKIDLIGLA